MGKWRKTHRNFRVVVVCYTKRGEGEMCLKKLRSSGHMAPMLLTLYRCRAIESGQRTWLGTSHSALFEELEDMVEPYGD